MFKSLAKKIKPKTRKRLRKWVSSSLRFLPKKSGDRAIVFLNGLVSETMGRRRDIKQKASEEASKLSYAAKVDDITGLVIFDLDVSPATVGDFIYAVIIGRWMINHGFDTKVVVASYRASVTEGIELLVSDYKMIADTLLEGGELLITEKSGKQASEHFSKDAQADSYILFEQKVLKSQPTYQYFFYLANVLHAHQGDIEPEQSFLFSRREFPIPKKRISGQYIVCHARFNENYGIHRNTTRENLLRIIVGIRSVLGDFKIIVASDRLSDEYYLPVVRRFPGEVFLASEFSDSFLGDCGLIMNASCYFAYNGGGISAVPMFSRLPYIICARARNEICWEKSNLTSWQLKHQQFLSPDEHPLPSFNWALLNRSLAPQKYTKSAD